MFAWDINNPVLMLSKIRKSGEKNRTYNSEAQPGTSPLWLACAVGCGRVYTLVQKENLEMRIMGFKAPHCGTVGNSLEGGRTVEKAGREGSLKHFDCPGRTAGWWRRHRRATAGPETGGHRPETAGLGRARVILGQVRSCGTSTRRAYRATGVTEGPCKHAFF